MSGNKNADHDLADYLYRRLQHIEQCNAEIETKICDDRMNLSRQIDNGDYTKNDPALGQIIFHLELVVGNTFRYAMLLGVCSYLEEGLRAIAKRLVADFETRLQSQRKGNWLHRHIRILADVASLDVAPIQSDLNAFHDLIIIRNCIAHAWGKISEARDPSAVRAAASRVETADISRDGYLVLGDQVVPNAIVAAENIAESILTSKLNVTMT